MVTFLGNLAPNTKLLAVENNIKAAAKGDAKTLGESFEAMMAPSPLAAVRIRSRLAVGSEKALGFSWFDDTGLAQLGP